MNIRLEHEGWLRSGYGRNHPFKMYFSDRNPSEVINDTTYKTGRTVQFSWSVACSFSSREVFAACVVFNFRNFISVLCFCVKGSLVRILAQCSACSGMCWRSILMYLQNCLNFNTLLRETEVGFFCVKFYTIYILCVY